MLWRARAAIPCVLLVACHASDHVDADPVESKLPYLVSKLMLVITCQRSDLNTCNKNMKAFIVFNISIK